MILKIIAISILIIITLRQAARAMYYSSNEKEWDKFIYVLFPTVVMGMMLLGAI